MNKFGKNIKIEYNGASHSEYIEIKIKNLPVGFPLDKEELQSFVSLRAPGGEDYSTKRREADNIEFMSGLTGDKINKSVFRARIYNKDRRSADYGASDIPRPSHADYPARIKHGNDFDLSGGSYYSGRMTALLCIAGGIALQLLRRQGIEVISHISSIGSICDIPFDAVNPDIDQLIQLQNRRFPLQSVEAETKMKQLITETAEKGDSIGGTCETMIANLPVAIGDGLFGSVEARIADIVFSIPAVKGIEFGAGFLSGTLNGSENNDEYYVNNGQIKTYTNNAGGICGGMTTGMPLIFKTAVKPTPSIAKKQRSVCPSTKTDAEISIKGRHDPCIVGRAVHVIRAAAAFAVLDLIFEKGNPNE